MLNLFTQKKNIEKRKWSENSKIFEFTCNHERDKNCSEIGNVFKHIFEILGSNVESLDITSLKGFGKGQNLLAAAWHSWAPENFLGFLALADLCPSKNLPDVGRVCYSAGWDVYLLCVCVCIYIHNIYIIVIFRLHICIYYVYVCVYIYIWNMIYTYWTVECHASGVMHEMYNTKWSPSNTVIQRRQQALAAEMLRRPCVGQLHLRARAKGWGPKPLVHVSVCVCVPLYT